MSESQVPSGIATRLEVIGIWFVSRIANIFRKLLLVAGIFSFLFVILRLLARLSHFSCQPGIMPRVDSQVSSHFGKSWDVFPAYDHRGLAYCRLALVGSKPMP